MPEKTVGGGGQVGRRRSRLKKVVSGRYWSLKAARAPPVPGALSPLTHLRAAAEVAANRPPGPARPDGQVGAKNRIDRFQHRAAGRGPIRPSYILRWQGF